MAKPTQTLTQEEFAPADFDAANEIARRLGYEQTAYTTTSALWGLFLINENPERWRGKPRALQGGCIIKTRELGLLVVQDLEALHMTDLDPRRARQVSQR